MATGALLSMSFLATLELSILLLLVSYEGAAAASSSEGSGQCDPTTANASRRWSFSLQKFRNESGDIINFTSTRELEDSTSSASPSLHLSETVFECDGKKFISLQGTLRDPSSGARLDDRLRFHHKTSPNTALTNKGFTVVKLKLDDNGSALTHRPLRTGELFEVRMDKRGTAKNAANGIGITTLKPEDGGLPSHMTSLKNGTWILFGPNVWMNGNVSFNKYTESSIYNLKPGDRMGVMRTDTGALHFFVNGVDQGPAAANIPEEVYGVYELYADATQATIVHPAHP